MPPELYILAGLSPVLSNRKPGVRAPECRSASVIRLHDAVGQLSPAGRFYLTRNGALSSKVMDLAAWFNAG